MPTNYAYLHAQCFRSEEPVSSIKEDLYIRKKHYYKRHGVSEFVRGLNETGRFDVCVYTSMMAHNVEAGLNAIMPGYKQLLVAVLDRSVNKADPEGTNEWDTVRDMNKVRCLLLLLEASAL